MTYDEAKKHKKELELTVKTLGSILAAFPRLPNGLGSDAVKSSLEYRHAKTVFDKAFADLRAFNALFCRTFHKERRAERKRNCCFYG